MLPDTLIHERENPISLTDFSIRPKTDSSALLKEQPEIIAEHGTKYARDYSRAKKHCLLIYDRTHDEFDQTKFSGQLLSTMNYC